MHGTAVEKGRTDSHNIGRSCDPDLVSGPLAGSTLQAVNMARPTANLRPGGSGSSGTSSSAAASAAQLNFYEELCNRQLYRSSLHNLLTSCGGSPAGGVNAPPSLEARSLTLGRNSVPSASPAEWHRRTASVATLTTPARTDTPACAKSASAAAGSGSPQVWSHAPASTAEANSAQAAQGLLQSGFRAPDGTALLSPGQLGLLPPPPAAAAVATAAAAGLRQQSALHKRARSMDDSASRHQKHADSVASVCDAVAMSAAVMPANQLPTAFADQPHSSQVSASEQQPMATGVKPRQTVTVVGEATKRSLQEPGAANASAAVPVPASVAAGGITPAGSQKVVLRKSLSSSSGGDRGRSLSCTPTEEKEYCLPPSLTRPPSAMAAAPSTVAHAAVGSGSSYREATIGVTTAAGAKMQASQGSASKTLTATPVGGRQRHAMHVDESNYVVMAPVHVRSSSGIVDGCTNRSSTSSSLSADRRHSARSLEELSACVSAPLLSGSSHPDDQGTTKGRGSSAAASQLSHPRSSGQQPVPQLPSSTSSGDGTDGRVGSAGSCEGVQTIGEACYSDNTYENVYRNGVPLCEPVVYANVSAIIRPRASQGSAAKTDHFASAGTEGRCVLPPSLPPPPPPACDSRHRSCTPPACAQLSSVADGLHVTQSTMVVPAGLRTGSAAAACHCELPSPASSVASSSSVFARMPSSCSVSNSSINSCTVAAEREAQASASSCDLHSPGVASSPIEEGERPGSRGTGPLYVNVQECMLPSSVPPAGCGGSRSSPRPPSPPPELNYAELVHTTPPAMVSSSTNVGGGSSSSSLARKRQSPGHPSTTLLRGISGTSAKVDTSSDGVLYAEINIAATEAAHKAQVHQSRYRQEQRNGLKSDSSGGSSNSSAQPTTGAADR